MSVQSDLVKLENLIRLTHESLRRTARALHPSILEHYGLVIALRTFTQELSTLTQRAGVVFEMGVFPDFPRLHRMVETTAYRIAPEAITNAFQHPEARKISVKLSLEEDVASIVQKMTAGASSAERSKKAMALDLPLCRKGLNESGKFDLNEGDRRDQAGAQSSPHRNEPNLRPRDGLTSRGTLVLHRCAQR